jgi:hypothetical protein
MSSATITIAYDGPALRYHAMDVRDLAPAMLGVGQLFDAANSALNGENARVRVQVVQKQTDGGLRTASRHRCNGASRFSLTGAV